MGQWINIPSPLNYDPICRFNHWWKNLDTIILYIPTKIHNLSPKDFQADEWQTKLENFEVLVLLVILAISFNISSSNTIFELYLVEKNVISRLVS